MPNDRDPKQNEEGLTNPNDDEMMGRADEENDDDFEDTDEVDADEDEVEEG